MSVALSALPITVEQYEQFEGYPGLRDELINGKIVMSPHAKPLHQLIAQNTEKLLTQLVNSTPFYVNRDTNFKFTELHSMPSPDVFVVRRDVFVAACRQGSYMSTPPVLAVEVLSPANRKARVAQKVDLYLRAGVLSVWVVEPKNQRIQVHTGTLEAMYQLGDAVRLESPA